MRHAFAPQREAVNGQTCDENGQSFGEIERLSK
jgi:hypothetical protein